MVVEAEEKLKIPRCIRVTKTRIKLTRLRIYTLRFSFQRLPHHSALDFIFTAFPSHSPHCVQSTAARESVNQSGKSQFKSVSQSSPATFTRRVSNFPLRPTLRRLSFPAPFWLNSPTASPSTPTASHCVHAVTRLVNNTPCAACKPPRVSQGRRQTKSGSETERIKGDRKTEREVGRNGKRKFAKRHRL